MDKEKSIAAVLGLLGGILWVYSATSPLVTALGHANRISDIWQMRGLNILMLSCIVLLIFAIIGLIGAIKIKSKNNVAGLMMLISAFGGIIFAFMLYGALFVEYTLAFIFLLIAGIMALRG